jgi:nucleoside 2-deoxyribosyltransferase
VYLAGPVSGLPYHVAAVWRREVARRLRRHGIEALVPLVGEKALRKEKRIDPRGYPDVPGCRPNDVFRTDVDMLEQADWVLVNLLGAKTVSIGTVWEIGWAVAKGVPVVLVMEDGNPHDHLFITQSTEEFSTVDEAIKHILDSERRFAEDYAE